MKKMYAFDTLSTKGCVDCSKLVKQRLIEIKAPQNIERCYKCNKKLKKARQNSG